MTNQWEKQNDLDPYDPSDAGEDKDDDGHTNLEEFNEDTDPTNSDSHPEEAKGNGKEGNTLDWMVYLLPISIGVVMVVILFICYNTKSGENDHPELTQSQFRDKGKPPKESKVDQKQRPPERGQEQYRDGDKKNPIKEEKNDKQEKGEKRVF